VAEVTDVADLTARIVDIWRRVMGTDDVGPDTHLLDVGANSLSAVRIRSRIRAELGKEIELVELFDNATPRAQAEVLLSAPDWGGPDSWEQLDWSAEPEAAPDGPTR
jgi:acyl carrier protein